MLRQFINQTKKHAHILKLSSQIQNKIYSTSSTCAATNSIDIFNVHRDTPENNFQTKFDFTPENYKKVNEIVNRYPPNYKRSAVIPLLDIGQQQNGGWISLAVMNKVAEILEMPQIRVYEVGTFYTMFNRSKIGKYQIMVCGTTPCMLNGSQGLVEAISNHLKIKIGQTTKDGLFTLTEMECMGCCVNAPMIAVADFSKGVKGYSYNYFEDLTPKDAISIIEKYKNGKIPKIGSQYRSKAEPVGSVFNEKWQSYNGGGGEMTLTEEPRGPYAPNLA